MVMLLLLGCVGAGPADTSETGADSGTRTDSNPTSDSPVDTSPDSAPDDTATAETGDTGDTGDPPPDAGRRFEGGAEYEASSADATVDGSVGLWVGTGDLDGDGVADLATGDSSTGITWLYGGLAAGDAWTTAEAFASVTGDTTPRLGALGASCGDLTGDGADDLVLADDDGAGVVMSGPFVGASTESDAFATFDAGTAFAGIDADGDGATDLLVGDPADGGDVGAAWLLAGPLTGDVTVATDAVLTIEGQADWYLGGDVADLGDLDGDGLGEIGVLAGGADLAGAPTGAVFVFFGAPTGTLAALDADLLIQPSAPVGLGGALGGPGDLDGDGRDDLVVAHQGAWVFAGPLSSAALTELDATAVIDVDLSSEVEPSIDFDADGRGDLVVGCPSSSRISRAYLYYGPLSGTYDATAADASFTDYGYYDRFGGAMVAADLDADRIEDLVFADGDTGGGGKRMYVFFGGL